jgi:Fic family protein
VRNAILQHRRIRALIPAARGEPEAPGHQLRLTPELIKDLHHFAIHDIYPCAGRFREWPIKIDGSSFRPPESRFVEGLVQEMCERANGSDRDPIETAAFLLWKLNWIHPFGGGNGRTSRAVAHLALCVRLGLVLPGNPTITEYIDANRKRYEDALRDADRAWLSGNTIDVRMMTGLINDMLEEELGAVAGPDE